jgi:hypothetical protein
VIPSDQLFTEIIAALRTMEAEAVPCADGTLTGIRGYCDHVNPERRDKRNVVENLWSDGIALRLQQRGIHAETQVPYPVYNGWCDLVVPFDSRSRIWIEVKGEWREVISGASSRSNSKYRDYIRSTAADVDKLNTLTQEAATHVGLLVIGFDRRAAPIRDEDLSPIVEKMRPHQWTVHCESWDDQWFKGFRIRIWFWSRAI